MKKVNLLTLLIAFDDLVIDEVRINDSNINDVDYIITIRVTFGYTTLAFDFNYYFDNSSTSSFIAFNDSVCDDTN